MINMLLNLIYRVGFIIMLALLLSRAKGFRYLFTKEYQTTQEKIIMGIFFGILSVVGTYTGISVRGAIANTRVIGVAIGGLLGGPFVGFMAGAIGGSHRYLMNPSGFTAVSCGLATCLEGLIAGLFSKSFKESKNKIVDSFMVGILIESFQMAFILLVTRPFSEALELVKIVGVPMILNNSLGMSMFVMIILNIREIATVEATFRSKQSLLIADKTLQYLRYGLNEDSAFKTAQMIYSSTDFDAVSLTSNMKILAHIGVGDDHHRKGGDYKTAITKQAVQTNKIIVVTSKEDIGCENKNCKLSSCVLIPLSDGLETKGVLKVYKTTNTITPQDVELAKGIGNICSTQLELNRLEDVSKASTKLEIKALQSQINPHFLFNAINTIVSLIRTSPESARNLLIHLSDYFRMNMQNSKDFIPLSKELDHIKAYLIIEKARFSERLNVEYRLNCNMNFLIPPLIIQPIVENAVKHGIHNNINGGDIIIDISDDSEGLCIKIIDNGVGMDALTISNINTHNEDYGIGLSNVYKRIKSYYGDNGKFTINSELNHGTTVTIEIIKREDFND